MGVRRECIDATCGPLIGSGVNKVMHILKISYCNGFRSTIMHCTSYHCAIHTQTEFSQMTGFMAVTLRGPLKEGK